MSPHELKQAIQWRCMGGQDLHCEHTGQPIPSIQKIDL
jgi:hypothetical protein